MPEAIFHYGQRRLENDLPNVHVARFVEEIKTHPEIFTYIAFPVVETEADFLREVYEPCQASPEECLYAVIDKATGNKYAGVISLSHTNAVNAVTEMGAIVFPEFQRTHVGTNAIGLALLYMLDPPPTGGLGLRRVEWLCHAGNAVSRKTALRMGFEFEGILRWHRAFARGSPVEALEKRNGTTGEVPGRHTAVYSIVWDDWDETRPKVVAQMERKQ
ncbi:hypothetical protein N7474_002218 [Penicillium riverlandense]|uniref:uncharacterized protein n=1 Tax=Penicillium riverlandense TaxID=1903569 RepID=UPI0025475995|nr:uncharacterized protein N7474_002218 [Penicillium riverlandense]KAJ5833907.1 hypothetical protein N7474_002218 [Penicillium riverlandense]